MRVQIKDSTLQRDIKSLGLVETDLKKVDEYRARTMMMNAAKSNKEEINSIKDKLSEIDSLKSDLSEIKSLLKSLIHKE